MPTSTPWGASQGSKKYARGIVCYTTAGHGGFHVSPTMTAKMPAPYRLAGGWYEEDCEAARVILSFPHLFAKETVDGAVKMMKDYYPDAYEAVTGEVIPEAESREKRERIFKQEAAKSMVAISAVGDWHENCPKGSVLVLATIGGKREAGFPGGKYFIVPDEAYKARGEFGFIVDPAVHQEAAKGF